MLTLTDTASVLIKNLTDQTASEEAGLRISAAEGTPNLTVDVTASPEPNDTVVEHTGARVFLEETAAAALDDKELDAQVDEAGAIRFAINDQS
jgi:iron-sulfur cluster assembly protein